jgi:hypothetical protein
MKLRTILAVSAIVAGCSVAYAANTMTAAPSESWTVLVDKSGKVTGLVVGVGGFLGAGEKDVIVPYTAVKTEKKNDKWWLTLDETKDSLKGAPGFTYDKASTTWVPDKK